MIVSVKEVRQRRQSQKKSGKVSHTRVWLVITDNAHDGTAAAINATGIPIEGDSYDGDTSVSVTSVTAEPRDNSAYHFEVTVVWESQDLGFDSSDLYPLDRPPDYAWGGNDFTEAYFIDNSKNGQDGKGVPVVNKAGDPFEQFYERDNSEIVITVTQNVATWDTTFAAAYNNTTNADVVIIDGTAYAVDVCKMGVLTASKVREIWQNQTVDYYKRVLNIKVKKDGSGWHDQPLNYGYNYIVEAVQKINGVDTTIQQRMPILDAAGLRINKPWPLDINGHKMPSATDVPPALDFVPYSSVPWAELLLLE